MLCLDPAALRNGFPFQLAVSLLVLHCYTRKKVLAPTNTQVFDPLGSHKTNQIKKQLDISAESNGKSQQLLHGLHCIAVWSYSASWEGRRVFCLVGRLQVLSLMHSTPAWKRSFLKYKSAKGGTSVPLPQGEAEEENVLVTRHVGAETIPRRRFHGKMSTACSLSYK